MNVDTVRKYVAELEKQEAELEAELSRRPVVNALVLLKGSHGIGLEHCIGRF